MYNSANIHQSRHKLYDSNTARSIIQYMKVITESDDIGMDNIEMKDWFYRGRYRVSQKKLFKKLTIDNFY